MQKVALMQLMRAMTKSCDTSMLRANDAHMHDVQITRESPNYRLG